MFDFNVPAVYPHEPPKVKCTQKIYHPNVDTEGNVCLNILREDWSPVLSISSCVYGLQFLFMDPNPDDPLNKEAARDLTETRAVRAQRPPRHAGRTRRRRELLRCHARLSGAVRRVSSAAGVVVSFRIDTRVRIDTLSLRRGVWWRRRPRAVVSPRPPGRSPVPDAAPVSAPVSRPLRPRRHASVSRTPRSRPSSGPYGKTPRTQPSATNGGRAPSRPPAAALLLLFLLLLLRGRRRRPGLHVDAQVVFGELAHDARGPLPIFASTLCPATESARERVSAHIAPRRAPGDSLRSGSASSAPLRRRRARRPSAVHLERWLSSKSSSGTLERPFLFGAFLLLRGSASTFSPARAAAR